MISIYHIACLAMGYFLTIGIGSLLHNDWNTFFVLIESIVLISIGWLMVPLSLPKISLLTHTRHFEYYKLTILVWSFVALLFYIAIRYGLPMLSQDATASRLLQRHYFIAMGLMYVIVPSVASFAYLLYRQNKLMKLKFYFILTMLLVGTSLLSVRYVFLEAVLVLLVLSLYYNQLTTWVKNLIPVIIIVVVFFVAIQALRATNSADSLLMDKIISRAFLINYEIFKDTAFGVFDLPVSTYVNSFNKLLGNGGYNIGFVLFNRVEGNTLIQGYAPISLIGEVFVNFGRGLASNLFLVLVGVSFRVLYHSLLSLFCGQYAIVFTAYFGMELFRTSAHSYLGMLIAILSFSFFLLVIQQSKFLHKSSLQLDGRNPPLTFRKNKKSVEYQVMN